MHSESKILCHVGHFTDCDLHHSIVNPVTEGYTLGCFMIKFMILLKARQMPPIT